MTGFHMSIQVIFSLEGIGAFIVLAAIERTWKPATSMLCIDMTSEIGLALDWFPTFGTTKSVGFTASLMRAWIWV